MRMHECFARIGHHVNETRMPSKFGLRIRQVLWGHNLEHNRFDLVPLMQPHNPSFQNFGHSDTLVDARPHCNQDYGVVPCVDTSQRQSIRNLHFLYAMCTLRGGTYTC